MSLLHEIANSLGVEAIGDIRWAHAINSRQTLAGALSSENTNFIEVDISLSADGRPIAAHPPTIDSDLSFLYLVNTLKKHNKGLKLDFKNTQTISPCLEILSDLQLAQPIILNADVLTTTNAPSAEIDAHWFIDTCLKFNKHALLSLGWRTTDDPTSYYSDNDISEMLAVCAGVKNVTFPVRAQMLPNCWSQVLRLLQEDSYSLTLWDSTTLSKHLSRWVKENTEPSRCFYDVTLT